MKEYEDRREIEKFYEKAKKSIKQKIEAKGISCKGSAKGTALSEIISVLDAELEIGIGEELVNARRALRIYYKKYNEVESLERQIKENEQELKEQEQVVSLVSYLTDDVLKNAVIAYNAIKDGNRYGNRYGNKDNAKEIAIAYIKSKGREDLKDIINDEE